MPTPNVATVVASSLSAAEVVDAVDELENALSNLECGDFADIQSVDLDSEAFAVLNEMGVVDLEALRDIQEAADTLDSSGLSQPVTSLDDIEEHLSARGSK